jgi:hypothetical protein
MTRTRFQVCYTPRAKLVAAAKANGWTEDGGESGDNNLLDAVGDYFSFEEVDSEYPTLGEAITRARRLVTDERDFFGQTTVEEQEYQLTIPADGIREWVTVARHNVDETEHVETVREEDSEQ